MWFRVRVFGACHTNLRMHHAWRRAPAGDKTTPWDLFYYVLKMCDATQAQWYLAEGQPAEVVALHDVWLVRAVTRANTVLLHAHHTEWPLEVEVETWCSRVGKSSWDVSQLVRRVPSGAAHADDVSDGRREGDLLAEVITTMVSVDETLTSPAALPGADAVRPLVDPPPFDVDVPRQLSAPAAVAPVHTLEGAVRLVDTDSLGHVNNAKWSFLACEAVHDACAVGALGAGVDAAELLASVDSVAIDYTGQLTPRERFACAVSASRKPGKSALADVLCAFTSSKGSLVCSVTMRSRSSPSPSL